MFLAVGGTKEAITVRHSERERPNCRSERSRMKRGRAAVEGDQMIVGAFSTEVLPKGVLGRNGSRLY
jgi:hypothetical protein